MSVSRRTVRVDFTQVPKKPSHGEALKYIWDKLGKDTEKVVRVHARGANTCMFLQMQDQASAQAVVEEHANKHSVQCDGKEYPIPFLMDDQSVIVRLHDLTADISDTAITSHLARHGEVFSIREGCWGNQYPCKGLPDGNKYVTMVVSKPIPSYITIHGETTLVTYRGQTKTCKSCQKEVHHGITCSASRKLLQQSSVNERLKFANVVATNDAVIPSSSSAPKPVQTAKANAPKTAAPQTSIRSTQASDSLSAVASSSKVIGACTSLPVTLPTKETTSPSLSAKSVEASTENKQSKDPDTTTTQDAANFKVPLTRSSSLLSLPILSASSLGKRATEDSSDSDASVASLEGPIRRKPGRPPKATKTEVGLVDGASKVI